MPIQSAVSVPLRSFRAQAEPTITASAPSALALSVVVPCYNEAESLPPLLDALQRLKLQLAPLAIEFVMVDDGSIDTTWKILCDNLKSRADVQLIRHESNRGIAAAIDSGIRAARSEVVASIDADCTYDPLQLQAMLPLLTDDVDLVVASPYHPQGEVRGVPKWRLAISQMASRLYARVLHNQLHTYTSCFRVYRRSSVLNLPPCQPGFVGVVEMVWQVDSRGGRVVEAPAVLTVRTTGQSKMRVLRATLAHLKLLARATAHRVRSWFSAAPVKRAKSISKSPSRSGEV